MNKKKEYIDLANQLIRQILTDENIEKMENCIKRKEVFRVEYSKGGQSLSRGYYCPSLLEEIFVTNISRGRILKIKPKTTPGYIYYFNDKNLVLVENLVLSSFEWIGRKDNIEYSINRGSPTNITVSIYEKEHMKKNIFLTAYNKSSFDFAFEEYEYDNTDKMFCATRKEVAAYWNLFSEETFRFEFFYDRTGNLLKCMMNDVSEVRVPPVIRSLITGKQKTVKKPLCKTDISKALKNAVTSWKNENIYAISVFINHSGDEVTDFAISFNTEEHQVGEERWNYAFWNQEEKDLMYLLEERETDWKKLLELTSSAVRKLQEDGFFKKVFGKDIAVIIHGYEYEDIELEATRNANPNGQAEEFFDALKNYR